MVTYRYADPADAEALALFAAAKFVEAYRDQLPAADLEAYTALHFTAAKVRAEIASAQSVVVIAEAASKIAGYALAWLESSPDCELPAVRPAELQRLYVDPGWQGKGVAGELVGRVLSAAGAAGCDVVWLAVWDANARAIRFYQKAGFEVAGEQSFLLGGEQQRDFVMVWPPR